MVQVVRQGACMYVTSLIEDLYQSKNVLTHVRTYYLQILMEYFKTSIINFNYVQSCGWYDFESRSEAQHLPISLFPLGACVDLVT
jgi:hypothetical protein